MKLKLAEKVMKNKLLYISILAILSGGLFYSGWQMFNAAEDVPESNTLESSEEAGNYTEKNLAAEEPIAEIREGSAAVAVINKKEVERYGVIVTNSSSGSLRLRYYDIEQKKVLDSWEKYPGFWASVEDTGDREGGIKLFEYIQGKSGSVFKIVGQKESDDCGYWYGTCLENIVIKKIEAVEIIKPKNRPKP